MRFIFTIFFLILFHQIVWCQAEWYRHYKRGLDAFESHDYNSAIQELEIAIKFDPEPELDKFISGGRREDYLPYYFLGFAYEQKGDYKTALAYLEKSEKFGVILKSEYNQNFITTIDRLKRILELDNSSLLSDLIVTNTGLKIKVPQSKILNEKYLKELNKNLEVQINNRYYDNFRFELVNDTLQIPWNLEYFLESANILNIDFQGDIADSLWLSSVPEPVLKFRGVRPIWRDKFELKEYIPYTKSRALIIAISNYNHESGFRRLPNAVTQAETLATLLESYDFQVKRLYNDDANKKEIESALYGFKAGSNDRVLIYFGGHGYSEKTEVGDQMLGYLVPHDGKLDNLDTLIPMSLIRGDYAYLIKGKHVLFLLDACASGLVTKMSERKIEDINTLREIKRLTEEPGRFAYVAGQRDEPALDINGGIFTRAIINAIKSGSADRDNNGLITLNELEDYVDKEVYKVSREGQHPTLDRDLIPNLKKSQFIFFCKRK